MQIYPHIIDSYACIFFISFGIYSTYIKLSEYVALYDALPLLPLT